MSASVATKWAAACGPMLFASSQFESVPIIAAAGIEVYRNGLAMDGKVGLPLDARDTEASEVFGPCAGAALYNRRALDEVSFFDPAFFAYLEDADLAWRLRLAGWHTLYVPQAHVWHEYSGTSGQNSPFKNFQLGRNRVWTILKNMPGRLLLRHLPAILLYDFAASLYTLRQGNRNAALGRLAALKPKELERVWQQRRQIQKQRTASLTDIEAWLLPSPPLWGTCVCVRRWINWRKYSSKICYNLSMLSNCRKIRAVFISLLAAAWLLSACSDEVVVGGATPTALEAKANTTAASRVAITFVAPPTSTLTQMVALVATNTLLPIVDTTDTPTPAPIAQTALTPQIAAPTITPIIPTPKKFTPTPGPSISPPISATVAKATTVASGNVGDTQQLNTLRTTKVSFLTAYNRAAKAVTAVQPAARIVLAQANYFTTARTGWSFYFVWPGGPKMYVATFDSAQANISINDSQPPILTQDAGQIQMERVLDSPAIVTKAQAAGIATTTPIDSIYFERYGTPSVPAYICTNGIEQKQLIINAYTGQILKNDFK